MKSKSPNKTQNPKIDLKWKSKTQNSRTFSVAEKNGFLLTIHHYKGEVRYYWEIRKIGRKVLESGSVNSLYGARALAKSTLQKILKESEHSAEDDWDLLTPRQQRDILEKIGWWIPGTLDWDRLPKEAQKELLKTPSPRKRE